MTGFFYRGAPTEIRTPVVALKGPRPRPLDDGGSFFERANSIIPLYVSQAIWSLHFRLHSLMKQSHQVNLVAIDQHSCTFHPQIWNKDPC